MAAQQFFFLRGKNSEFSGCGGALPITKAPLPVTVQVADSGRWLPYPNGKRNSFSAVAKWLEVAQRICSPYPADTVTAPRDRDSPMVEQAP